MSAKQEVNKFIFTVRNNRIGIEPEYAERIFIPFYRLHGKCTRLGLTRFKKMLNAMGAYLD
ncbi:MULTISPECIES: hypothetical protein [Nitrosomonas]|uniref:hypothetical protein n=1 Tax=Nitrosomonas TaxID=914 RepID=UPI003709A48E